MNNLIVLLTFSVIYSYIAIDIQRFSVYDQFIHSLNHSNITTKDTFNDYRICLKDIKSIFEVKKCLLDMKSKHLNLFNSTDKLLPENRDIAKACQHADIQHMVCQYDIEQINNSIPTNKTITLRINQHSCPNSDKLVGGTSFDVLYSLRSDLHNCKLHDHYNSSYTVICPTNHYQINSHKSQSRSV
jgi:hypothetical protein